MEPTQDQQSIRLATPKPFIESSSPLEDWNNWREQYQLFELAAEISSKPRDVRRATLLTILGPKAYQTYKTLDFPSDQQELQTSEHILDAFSRYYKPYKNITFASYAFNKLVQTEGQSVADFVKQLKLLAGDCDFQALKDRLIRDRIVVGIRDDSLRQRLLREQDPSLAQVIHMCVAAEVSHAQSQLMVASAPAAEPRVERITASSNSAPPSSRRPFLPSSISSRRPCSRCGSQHKPRNCPAFGKTCFNCGLQGHFSQICRQPKFRTTNIISDETSLNNVISDETSPNNDILYLDMILDECSSLNDLTWTQDIKINGMSITFKLDTGADVNIIPQRLLFEWPLVPVTSSPLRIITYTGHTIPVLGTCELQCTVNNKSYSLPFVVAKIDAKPILGAKSCQQLGLLQRIHSVSSSLGEPHQNAKDIVKKHESVFIGRGQLPGFHHITLRPDVAPVVVPARKVPIAIEPLLKQELQRMQNEGIIAPVTQPTEWVNALIVVHRKDGRLRLCLDPRPLNKAILRQHFHLPTQEELLSKISGATVFTVLDASDGFWHIALDYESSLLCTFATPYGRYRFLVLPFGIASAPELFQCAMDNVFASEQRLNPYFDDLLIAGRNLRDHDELLESALQLAENSNLKLNKNKLQLASPSVKYLGHVLTAAGIQPDPAKIEAITKYPTPTDLPQLQRFLGMVTYLRKFVQNVGEESTLLRQLLQKNAVFEWTQAHDQQFQHLKAAIANAPVLSYYQPQLPIVLSVDASSYGLGAVMLQNDKPIAFASQTLTPTQQIYPQIDKELYAIVYACEHFHFFTYGQPVEIHTDHKPLLGLRVKPFDKISPRLQRLLLRLQRYDLKLVYIPGKHLAIADALSRAPLPPPPNVSSLLLEEEDISACTLVQLSDARLQDLQIATHSDSTLQTIRRYIMSSWPSNQQQLAPEIAAYSHCQIELHIKDGLICRGSRIVVPQNKRQEILRQLHISHRGLTATQQQARETVYWPGITRDIQTMITACDICQSNRNHPPKEPLFDRPLPVRPWQFVSADFFHLDGTTYLIIADIFSKYVEVIPMTTSTAAPTLIYVFKTVFARHGLPEELRTDNGPPFDSISLTSFYKEHAIRHVTSSPLYPRSNGFIERTIQTIKKLLIKARLCGNDLADVLLDYRTKPLHNGFSPSELLMGRRLRSTTPILPDLLQPIYDIERAQKSLRSDQVHQHQFADQHTKPLPSLTDGQPVWYWSGQKWNPALIQSQAESPRSYFLRTNAGLLLRRNRVHIRPRSLTPKTMPSASSLPQSGNPNSYDDDIAPQEEDPVRGGSPPPLIQPTPQVHQQKSPLPILTSRCGRQINRPTRFKDYV